LIEELFFVVVMIRELLLEVTCFLSLKLGFKQLSRFRFWRPLRMAVAVSMCVVAF
jgi:hypothetical protein